MKTEHIRNRVLLFICFFKFFPYLGVFNFSENQSFFTSVPCDIRIAVIKAYNRPAAVV